MSTEKLNWGGKPKAPGRYRTRHHDDPKDKRCWHTVTVRRVGRGLQVIPDPPYHTAYAMSEIGDLELDWAILPSDEADSRRARSARS